MDINKLIGQIDELTDKMIQSHEAIYREVSLHLIEIKDIYSEYITIIPRLREIGLDIYESELLRQLQELVETIESKDIIGLYDCLAYEVRVTLCDYRRITEIMGR